MTDEEYRAYELRKVAGSTDVRLKVWGENGEMRWLSLTPELFAKVSAVLTEESA
ncbi:MULTISPECIES: hypothetical protein [unclassified Kitasatospora]|uniref:hypothetical protein n=1 Tax=unclassified Kitasatospora TaxID=2633591 RepID=UPI0037FF2960